MASHYDSAVAVSPEPGWPYTWPDPDWIEFARVTAEAVRGELEGHFRLTQPDDLVRTVRQRVLPYLQALAVVKADWLDGNLKFMVDAACRDLLALGKLAHRCIAYRTVDGGPECCPASKVSPKVCFDYGITSAVAASGSRIWFSPPANWAQHEFISVPKEWKESPLGHTGWHSTWQVTEWDKIVNGNYSPDYPTPFGMVYAPEAARANGPSFKSRRQLERRPPKELIVDFDLARSDRSKRLHLAYEEERRRAEAEAGMREIAKFKEEQLAIQRERARLAKLAKSHGAGCVCDYCKNRRRSRGCRHCR
jgi:hypothetical protein